MDKRDVVMIGKGECRGYRADEGGIMTIIGVAVIDGEPVNYLGEPYDMTGEITDLIGWPDTKAVQVAHNLYIAVK